MEKPKTPDLEQLSCTKCQSPAGKTSKLKKYIFFTIGIIILIACSLAIFYFSNIASALLKWETLSGDL